MIRNYRYIVSLASILVLAGITLVMLIIANHPGKNKAVENNIKGDTATEKRVEIATFQVRNGWGYDIYVNGKIFIHQPMIPALQGIKEFETEVKARKVAEFVADKIRRNILPPTISLHELDSLGVLN